MPVEIAQGNIVEAFRPLLYSPIGLDLEHPERNPGPLNIVTWGLTPRESRLWAVFGTLFGSFRLANIAMLFHVFRCAVSVHCNSLLQFNHELVLAGICRRVEIMKMAAAILVLA